MVSADTPDDVRPELARHGKPPFNQAVADGAVVACRECDLIQRLPELADGAAAHCPRCDKELRRRQVDALDRMLALPLAAAVLYVVANTVPMLGLSAVGHRASTTVLGGARQLWNDGRETVALLVLLTTVVAPALQIGFMLIIGLAVRRARIPRWVGTLVRHHPRAATWSMLEVMMLGVLVALVKIADYATVIPGLAMYALAALVVLLAMMQRAFDPQLVWNRIEWAEART